MKSRLHSCEWEMKRSRWIYINVEKTKNDVRNIREDKDSEPYAKLFEEWEGMPSKTVNNYKKGNNGISNIVWFMAFGCGVDYFVGSNLV